MPEQLTAPRAGLFTTLEVAVPLTGVSIDADVSTFCARVTVTQRYVNRESKPIEAVYVFPLDEGAAVCGFEAIIDGTLVVGEVKERETAFKMYDDAMEQGHGAYLVDEERPDVFQASVGNLPPGKEVLLKLTYVTELSIEGGAIRFMIPTTVSPRYAPPEDRVGMGRPDSETLNPPLAWSVPYGLDLTVRVATAGPVARIESLSHPVSISMTGTAATVTLSQRDAVLDRDFVLSVEAAGLDAPRGWMERDDDGTESVAVAFVPALPDASAPAEIVFLVDRSGSMGGKSIAEVRNALQLCLRSMIPGCFFNIVGFGSKIDPLFPQSRTYDERSLAEASEHVAGLEADLGGTEILPALKSVLETPRHGSLPRQVVVLTDGEVTNTDAVLALAAEHARDARIFTFGIGTSASHHLVRGLARAGRGVAEFIHPGERIEPKVVRQFGRLLSPALTNVRLEWPGADVTQAPSSIPPVFAGGRLLAYGFLKQRHSGSNLVRARLSADAPSGPVSWDVAVDATSVPTGRTVATLAARARIRELEESPAWTKLRGSQQSARKASAVAQEIVALSTRYGLISRETSFVAIERRDTPVQGDTQLRRVPIALSAGWGGLDQIHAVGARIVGAPPAPSLALRARHVRMDQSFESSMAGLESSSESAMAASMDFRVLFSRVVPAAFKRAGSEPPAHMPPSPPAEEALRIRMLLLIRLQRADGSWELNDDVAETVGHDLAYLETALDDLTAASREDRTAWATALALAWLKDEAGEFESEWGLLAKKGRYWLETHASASGGARRWIADAARTLRS